METENRLRLADVFVSITDPRQSSKVELDLVELLVIAVNAVLVGADTFVEIELWARERIDWLRRYLRLENGVPSHDTFGRLFGLIDPDEFEAAFRRWVRAVVPSPLPMIRCAHGSSMPRITSPSSSTSPLTSSASIQSSVKAASRPGVSSPLPPLLIANTSSDSFDVHAIAVLENRRAGQAASDSNEPVGLLRNERSAFTPTGAGTGIQKS